jgi:hypothetical protein
MPTPQLNLPQQFGRFLLVGALVFTVFFWGTSSILISSQDMHRDVLAIWMLLKSCFLQPFALWFLNLKAAYIRFFLRQRPLLACYLISVPPAWLAAFLYDVKILRKENIL